MKPKHRTYRWYRWSIPSCGIGPLEEGGYVYALSPRAARGHGEMKAELYGQYHLDATDVRVRLVKVPPHEWVQKAFDEAMVAERAAVRYRNHLGSLLAGAPPVPHLP